MVFNFRHNLMSERVVRSYASDESDSLERIKTEAGIEDKRGRRRQQERFFWGILILSFVLIVIACLDSVNDSKTQPLWGISGAAIGGLVSKFVKERTVD